MANNKIHEIVMLGAGNVATHLAIALQGKGFLIKQVYSRTIASACELAVKTNSEFCNSLDAIFRRADLYIVALSDNAVEEVLTQFNAGDGILVHTSGTLPMDLLQKSAHKYGVFYPLQTFSKNKPVDFNQVPICIEASNKDLNEDLFALALRLSNDVRQTSTEERQFIHLAAVFACNFSNYMAVIANDILGSRHIDFDILMPLMRESLEKLSVMSPWQAQTGPAHRHDTAIIEKHLKLLEGFQGYNEIYQLLTEQIIDRKQ